MFDDTSKIVTNAGLSVQVKFLSLDRTKLKNTKFKISWTKD